MNDGGEAPKLDPLLQTWRAIMVYGALTFAAGFVFGVLRELALVPWLGRNAGRWIEFAIMIALTFIVARMATQGREGLTKGAHIAIGVGGALVLLALEATFALYVARLPLEKYLESFDIAKGALFPFGLIVVAVAPLLIAQFGSPRSGR